MSTVVRMDLKRGSQAWIEAVQEERRSAVERFNARRNIEWRLTLTLWAGFALGANALLGVDDLGTGARWILTGLAIAVVGWHAVWVHYFMVRSAPKNWAEGVDLTDVLREELGLDDLRRAGEDPLIWMGHWWPVVFSLVLAAFVVVVAWQ